MEKEAPMLRIWKEKRSFTKQYPLNVLIGLTII